MKLLSHPNEPVDYSELILTNHIDENKAIDGDEMMATMTVGKTEAYDPVMDKKSLQQIYKKNKRIEMHFEGCLVNCNRKERSARRI